MNRQGNDRAAQGYRSAIYFVRRRSKKTTALDTDCRRRASRIWPGKVVTEVEPVSISGKAEPDIQDYLKLSNGYTCQFPRPDWVLPQTRGSGINTQKTAQPQ